MFINVAANLPADPRAAQAAALADAVKQRLGADAGLAEATVAPRHVLHADGKACGVETSSLCDIIAHPDTTVEDIEDRVFGHAQFECALKLVATLAWTSSL